MAHKGQAMGHGIQAWEGKGAVVAAGQAGVESNGNKRVQGHPWWQERSWGRCVCVGRKEDSRHHG